MPYTVSWLIENRLIYARHYGTFNSADLIAYLDESFAMRDDANARNGANGPLVHTLTDARDMSGQDMTLADMKRTMDALRQQRVGWSIYVSGERLTRFLASLGHQFAKVRYRAYDNMADAVAFLQQIDPSLPPIPAIDGGDPAQA